MGIEISYPFDTSTSYTYDSDQVEITGGLAKLKLIDLPNQDFNEPFDSDVGFTYDPTRVNFSGGKIQHIDQRPANSIIASTFTNGLDASWGADGVDTIHGENGSPSLDNGQLLCDYTVNSGQNGIFYEDSQIGALSGDWVAKFKYTPNYTTTPPENINIFSISQNSGTTDDLAIFNSPSGNNLRITANGLSAVIFDTWTPTAGVQYTFEIICISNQVSVYVDNVQIGTSKTISPAQGTTSNRVWLGAYPQIYNVASGKFDDFILYSTASQTPTYYIPEYIYLASNVEMPEMHYTGVGTLQQIESLTITETGQLRYTIQVGQSGIYLYWNGVAWVTSDGTYAQSNDLTTFNLHASTIDIIGEVYGQFKIHFPDTNAVQSEISDFTVTVTAQIYPTDNQQVIFNATIRSDELISFSETSTKTGSDEVKYILSLDGTKKYWDGLNWVNSDGTYSQSNLATDINTNASTLLTTGTVIQITMFLHSADGLTTPEVDIVTLSYDFAGDVPTLQDVTVWGYLRDLNSELVGETIEVTPIWTIGEKTIISDDTISTITVDDGYWEMGMIIEDVLPTYLNWKMKNKTYKTNFLIGIHKFSELTVISES